MVSDLFVYPLGLIALVWLCLMLHGVWPSAAAAAAACPTTPVYSTWSNRHIDSRVRATVLSMQSQTDAIGQIVGGPPLGALGERRLPLAFLASAAMLSPALWLLRRTERSQSGEKTVEVPAEET